MEKKNNELLEVKDKNVNEMLLINSPKKPRMESINPSQLLSRVKDFLPQIAEANKHLENTKTEDFDPIIVENSDSESENSTSNDENTSEKTINDSKEPTVEMNVLLFGCENEEKLETLIEEK